MGAGEEVLQMCSRKFLDMALTVTIACVDGDYNMLPPDLQGIFARRDASPHGMDMARAAVTDRRSTSATRCPPSAINHLLRSLSPSNPVARLLKPSRIGPCVIIHMASRRAP